MVHPTRIDPARYKRIKLFLRQELGLLVIECTPEEHDRMMAYSLGLSHYIGRVMQAMDIPQTELATRAYEDLLDMKRIQGKDSWELFQSIMHENPYALEVNQAFRQASQDLDKQLGI
jgi:prephenate dehydrogenase